MNNGGHRLEEGFRDGRQRLRPPMRETSSEVCHRAKVQPMHLVRRGTGFQVGSHSFSMCLESGQLVWIQVARPTSR